MEKIKKIIGILYLATALFVATTVAGYYKLHTNTYYSTMDELARVNRELNEITYSKEETKRIDLLSKAEDLERKINYLQDPHNITIERKEDFRNPIVYLVALAWTGAIYSGIVAFSLSASNWDNKGDRIRNKFI